MQQAIYIFNLKKRTISGKINEYLQWTCSLIQGKSLLVMKWKLFETWWIFFFIWWDDIKIQKQFYSLQSISKFIRISNDSNDTKQRHFTNYSQLWMCMHARNNFFHVRQLICHPITVIQYYNKLTNKHLDSNWITSSMLIDASYWCNSGATQCIFG